MNIFNHIYIYMLELGFVIVYLKEFDRELSIKSIINFFKKNFLI